MYYTHTVWGLRKQALFRAFCRQEELKFHFYYTGILGLEMTEKSEHVRSLGRVCNFEAEA